MGFSKINWNAGEVIAEIKIQEANGIKLGKWTIKAGDLGKFAQMVRKKFGINQNDRDEDLDWAR